jgi:hypothetical protein
MELNRVVDVLPQAFTGDTPSPCTSTSVNNAGAGVSFSALMKPVLAGAVKEIHNDYAFACVSNR